MYESSGVLPVNLSGWYRLRWAVLSPFHTRVSCGQRLGEYTLGEIILVVPIVLILCALNIMHFASGDAKSVEDSGSVAVLPLIAVFVLAARNSPLAFLIGIPFERAIFYHKLFAHLVMFLGTMHGLAAWKFGGCEKGHRRGNPARTCVDTWDGRSMMSDGDAITGIIFYSMMMAMVLLSNQRIRRVIFELFMYSHWLFIIGAVISGILHDAATMMIGFAIFTADCIFRYVYQAAYRHPQQVQAVAIGDVVRLSFPKGEAFGYMGGQYIFIAIPELSMFEWHPFSISSSPHQEVVTIHARALGNWTEALLALCVKKAGAAGPEASTTLTAYIEGPHGDQQLDLWGPTHTCFLLICGGIGVTPLQSIASQLVEQHARGRPVEKVSLVWSVRDTDLVNAVLGASPSAAAGEETEKATIMGSSSSSAGGVVDSVMETHIYLTQKKTTEPSSALLDCEKWGVKRGRPDLSHHFTAIKQTAASCGQGTVAVLTCGPVSLMEAVREMCHSMSDDTVTFECGEEVFEL